MGCITACFGSSKKHPISSPARANSLQIVSNGDAVKEALLSTHQRLAEEAQIAISAIKLESREKIDEDKLNVSTRKKVTFDQDVKIQEKDPIFSVDEVINCLSGKGENEGKDESDLVSDSTVSSLFSYPHDLRCCTSSDGDDGIESVNKEKNGCENSTAISVQEESSDSLFSLSADSRKKNGCENSTAISVQEESSDSLFSLSADSRKKNGCANSTAISVQEESSESLFSLSVDSIKKYSVADVEVGEKEVSSPLKPPSTNRTVRERSNSVQSVLKPIENLSQWKDVVRSKTTSLMMIPQEKENIELEKENVAYGFLEEPSFLKNGDEVAVDASLSSWLKGSARDRSIQNSPDSVGNSSSSKLQRANSSPKSLASRTILGALSVDELKKVQKGYSLSPGRSRGSYWRYTSEAIVGTDCKKVLSLGVLTMPF